MTVHIGLADQDDVLACVRLIAEALHDDPVVHQIVGGNRNRTDRVTDLYIARTVSATAMTRPSTSHG